MDWRELAHRQVASFTNASFVARTLQLQSGNLSVAGISLGSGAGALTFSSPGGGSAKILSIGASGIVNSSSHTLTVDVTSKVNIALTANASFIANGTIEIDDDTSRNSTTGFSIGSFALTLDGTSTNSEIEKGFSNTSGSVIKTGSGTWSLTGLNAYTGSTTLSGGVLSASSLADGGTVSSVGQSTNAAANLVFDGGTLQYTGGAVSTNRLFTLTATVVALTPRAPAHSLSPRPATSFSTEQILRRRSRSRARTPPPTPWTSRSATTAAASRR